MFKFVVAIATFIALPSFILGEVTRMTQQQILDIVTQIVPGKSILHQIDSLNPPTMVFVWHGSNGRVSDVMSKKDPFTGETKYKHSTVICNYKTTYFTSVVNTDVHVKGGIYLQVQNSLGTKLLWIAMGTPYSSNVILNSKVSETIQDIVFGGVTGGEDKFPRTEYMSREDAAAAIDTECSLKNFEDVSIADTTSIAYDDDGFLIRGQTERMPIFGNSAVFIME